MEPRARSGLATRGNRANEIFAGLQAVDPVDAAIVRSGLAGFPGLGEPFRPADRNSPLQADVDAGRRFAIGVADGSPACGCTKRSVVSPLSVIV